MAGGAALRTIPVVRARVTVTDTGAVGLDWCAAVTTVRSSEPTIMRRTTAVRQTQTGVPGQPGVAWLLELSGGNRSAGKSIAVSGTAAWAPGTLRRDTHTLNVFKLLQ